MGLREFIDHNPKFAVAYSGGVDSSYLLWAAIDAGADVKAYLVRSEFQPEFELEDARRVAEDIGADLVEISASVLEDETIASNPEDRCYHCKTRIMSAIKEAAAKDGYELIVDGTNASDEADDRPGMRALKEFGIRSPLRECNITKDEVRSRAKEAGLGNWDKPAYACLATRVPAGERITESKLKGTEKAEGLLFDMGFRDFRVRWRGHDALVQVREEQLAEAYAREDEIRTALGRICDYIEIDEKGR